MRYLILVRRIALPVICLVLCLGSTIHPAPAIAAPPVLWLPTPPGQTWRVIQGYGCGTHDDWDFYSLDLAAVDGMSAGAPVYAAAPGTVLAWVPASGTLILDHGGGFYTMYTHMASAPHTQRGELLSRGAQVGTVGDRGAPGNPHLHFTAFTGSGAGGRGARRSVPLRFAEGYDLPDIGGCDQHNGAELVSGIQPLDELPYRAYLPRIQTSVGTKASPATAPAIASPQPAYVAQIPRRWRAIVLGL